ncbi:MAG: hypothetical protein AB7L90_04275 [Hyphomicrobiaceae bacterium]
MKSIAVAMTAGMLLATPAFAQTKAPAKTAKAPTAAQCKSGYKQGMPWTKQEFTEACVKANAKSQGK